jgi:putative transposase
VRGFPWHRPPHPKGAEGWYLITAACYEHRHHFSAANELTALQMRLFEAFSEAENECGGWVVMPNHYHALVTVNGFTTLGKAIGKVHGRSSRYANLRDNAPRRRVWYKYSDRKIRSERHYWTCLHYMIANPVKHGFSETMVGWAWSCIHELLSDHGEEWIDELCREYPLLEFGKGWDDLRS